MIERLNEDSNINFLGNSTSASGVEVIIPKIARIPTTQENPWEESPLKIKGAGAGRLEFHLPHIAEALQKARNRSIKNGEITAGEDIAKNIQDLLKLKPGQVLVDLGMGPGIIAKHISKYLDETGWLYCVDASPSMLKAAQKELLGNNATLIHGDIQTVDNLIHEKADAAILSGNVHLLTNRELAFKAIYNMLKPDGKLVVVTHVNRNAKKETTKFASEIDKLEQTRPDLKVGGLRLPMLTEKELKEEVVHKLAKVGFTVLEIDAETNAPDVNEVLGQGNMPLHGVGKRLAIIDGRVNETRREEMAKDILTSLYEGTQMQTYLLCTKKPASLLPKQK